MSFDAAVSSDGNVLLLVDGRFGKSNLPTEAEISMAIRTETGFRRIHQSEDAWIHQCAKRTRLCARPLD